MACILNIETATELCSVAIGQDGQLLHQVLETEAYAHTRVLTLLIDQCLQEAGLQMQDLEAIAVSSGPGSYTALRVGVAAAKGICYAMDLPLIAVPTLQSMAAALLPPDTSVDQVFVPMIDARRMEVYTAVYDAKLKLVQEAEAVILNREFFKAPLFGDKQIYIGGNGSTKAQALFEGDNRLNWMEIRCEATHLLALSEARYQQGQVEDIAYYEPFYLKSPNITTPKKKLL